MKTHVLGSHDGEEGRTLCGIEVWRARDELRDVIVGPWRSRRGRVRYWYGMMGHKRGSSRTHPVVPIKDTPEETDGLCLKCQRRRQEEG